MAACHRAFDAYEDDAHFAEMRQAAMARSFSWTGAAAEYEALYRRLIGPKIATIRSVPQMPERAPPVRDTELYQAA
jgi:glycogen synthase